jgi:putative pyruvate formate lyase activating enzyme
MFRQVGSLKTDSSGIAYRGLCIRHLVLPDNKSSSFQILQFLKSMFDPQDLSISLMAQYKPLFQADKFSEINRTISKEE